MNEEPESAKPLLSSGVPDLLLSLFPFIGLCAGLVMWGVDAAIDVLFVNPEEEFWEAVFSTDDTEIWMRSLIVIVMTVSAVFAQYMLHRGKYVEKELRKYQLHLEDLVQQRTSELEKRVNVDELTQLYNRRKFLEDLAVEYSRANRYKYPFSIIISDIDHFKSVNDRFGHLAGDEVLRQFAHCLQQQLRKSDVSARWGGEEFIVLLPATHEDEALKVAKKLHDLVSSCCKIHEESVTASFGVAQYDGHEDINQVINRADQALYRAKQKGRDQVCR